MTKHLIFLSVPGLRVSDLSDPSVTPVMSQWAKSGSVAELAPSFPCVTSSVQASMWTGVGPSVHGVIANGFFHRERNQVEFWVARNNVVQAEQIWDVLAADGRCTSAVWHAQNIKDAKADYIVTPEPIHEPDGTTKLWCYSKPDGLYQQLHDYLGHFPLQNYWGPLAGIQSTSWILSAARWLIDRHNPNFHYIYIPHLDYASQKYGPDSPAAVEALRELDAELARFRDHVSASSAGKDCVFLLVSEYAMTPVSGAVHPNIALRRAGLLRTVETDEGELIDFQRSDAFAMVDHQCAHVYVRNGAAERAAELFQGLDGVESVHVGADRSSVGIDHPRSGDIVLVASPDRWFAYYWWLDDADAPPFARTVDIHRKPGYDPVELFIDPSTRSIPLNAALVKGSHGAPACEPRQRGAIVCSRSEPSIEASDVLRDVDVKSVVLDLLGIDRR